MDQTHIEWEQVWPASNAAMVDAGRHHDAAFHDSGDLRAFLSEAVQADESVTLVVNDPYRSTQTRTAMQAMSRLVRQSSQLTGLRFRVLVATGTHQVPRSRQREFEARELSDTGLRCVGVRWHDAKDARNLVNVGGLHFHQWLAESRFLLPIGSVEPHYFAGLTGPHKTVTIGCLSHADIERNHFLALHPDSDPMRLEGNPVYDGVADMVRGLESAGKKICCVAQVTNGENLLRVAVGDCLMTLHDLSPLVRETYGRAIGAPVDVLHLRVCPPLSHNLYQADKALKNNHRAVRNGGAIILESDCQEGVGPSQFLRLLRESRDYVSACHMVTRDGYRLGDHKAVKIRHLTDPACRGVKVVIVSPHLDPGDVEGTGLDVCPNVNDAIARLGDVPGSAAAKGLVVEDAAMMCVTAESEESRQEGS